MLKINLSPLLKEAPKPHQPQSPDQQGLIRQINNLSSNIGGPELIQLLTMLAFLMVLANCEGCKKGVVNIPKEPTAPISGSDASFETVPDSISSPDNSIQDNAPEDSESLKPGEATIDILVPEQDYFKVIGRIGAAKKGDTATVHVLITKPDKQKLKYSVQLTMGEFDAEGRLYIRPDQFIGSKLNIIDSEGNIISDKEFQL